MKYSSGGITGKLGEALAVEVPVKAKAAPPAAKDAPPQSSRLRLSAWTRSYELFYKNPKVGGTPDMDRARQFLDACAGKVDDLILLQTINIQIPKPPEGTPTGKVLWDSDFLYKDSDAPDLANRFVAEAHKRGIGVHAGYAVVDSGNESGRRGTAFKKFLETATDAQIKDHATQAVDILKLIGFDGLSFDLEVNGLSVAKHAAKIAALFTELASQMAPDNRLLSYAGYPFLKDGQAPWAIMNALPFSLAKGVKNMLVRPQAYRMASETMDNIKSRVSKMLQ